MSLELPGSLECRFKIEKALGLDLGQAGERIQYRLGPSVNCNFPVPQGRSPGCHLERDCERQGATPFGCGKQAFPTRSAWGGRNFVVMETAAV